MLYVCMPFTVLKSTKDFAANIKFHSGIFLFDFQKFSIYKPNKKLEESEKKSGIFQI